MFIWTIKNLVIILVLLLLTLLLLPLGDALLPAHSFFLNGQPVLATACGRREKKRIFYLIPPPHKARGVSLH